MKFDIIKYIDNVCQDYLQGRYTKALTLLEIKLALKENFWPMLCDGKEVVDYNGISSGTIEADNQVWSIHQSWCIKDKTEDEEK